MSEHMYKVVVEPDGAWRVSHGGREVGVDAGPGSDPYFGDIMSHAEQAALGCIRRDRKARAEARARDAARLVYFVALDAPET